MSNIPSAQQMQNIKMAFAERTRTVHQLQPLERIAERLDLAFEHICVLLLLLAVHVHSNPAEVVRIPTDEPLHRVLVTFLSG
jgi:hypothetical protein